MPDLVDGRYELLEVLASGGMATVWRARDTRLDRRVALKRPHPAPSGDPVHARIEREARAAASLNHPHLVTIFDVGRDETGPFIVMELVEGPTLTEAGPELDRPEALEVIAQVANALAVVHSAGIVHRDLKPSNVLMSDRGPQLTDFGIAVAGDATSRLTQDGTFVATPSYASPEQLEGGPATAKSDVFSLGVMLYELVAGRLPFPDTRRPHPPDPVGDPALDALLGRALSTEPNDRPEAAELASSLRSVAPTTTFPLGGGSTIPMAVPSPAPEAATEEPETAGRPIPLLMAGVGLAALIGLAAMIIATPDNPPEVGATVPSVPATSSPTTTPPTTLPATTSTPATTTTTTTTTVTTTTIPGPSAAVGDAQEELESSLSAAHPSDLNPNDVRELMEKADDAIEAVEDDQDNEADQKLREIAREIDDKLDDEVRHRSLESLVALAEALEISLEREDDDNDD